MLKNYLFVIDRIEHGGAERQMLRVANYISADAKVYITSLHPPSSELLNLIKIYNFVYLQISTSNGKKFYKRAFGVFKLIKSLKGILIEYQIDKCVSFLEWSNILTIIAAKNRRVPVCINVRNYLSTQYGSRSTLILKLARLLIARYYQHADAVICNSYGIKKDLVDVFQVPKGLISVIQNTYSIEEIKQKVSRYVIGINQEHSKIFCACGRLADQKRFESLILSFQEYIVKYNKRDTLIIIGSGENEEAIQKLIRLTSADVRLFPHQDNPYSLIASCDCFILHSDFEGFPNVLAEAVILGKDCISVDCMTGPREVLSGNVLIDYKRPITELTVLKYGLLYPYRKLNIESDNGLVNALHKYSTCNYQFNKSNYSFLCEDEGKVKWQKIL